MANPRPLGGFGVVVLLIVVAVVLLLAARALRTVAPEAGKIVHPAAHERTEHGDLPDLEQMQQQTDAHAEQLQEAIAEID